MAEARTAERPAPVDTSAPSQSTALATTDPRTRASYSAKAAEAKNLAKIVAEIRKTSWGTSLAPIVANAVAAWARRKNIDAVTELYVLGGNVYLNATFYMNRLAPYVREGVLSVPHLDHVHDDRRLLQIINGDEAILPAKMDPEIWKQTVLNANEEYSRRLRLRIAHNIDVEPPARILAACIATIEVRGNSTPCVGVKFITDRKKKKFVKEFGGAPGSNQEVFADPVGNAYPMETVETRAIRRAARLAVEQDERLAALRTFVENAEEDFVVSIDEAVATVAAEEIAPPSRQIEAGPAEDEAGTTDVSDIAGREPGDEPEIDDESRRAFEDSVDAMDPGAPQGDRSAVQPSLLGDDAGKPAKRGRRMD